MADRVAMAVAETCWKIADGISWVADTLGAASDCVNEAGHTVLDQVGQVAERWGES